jgi:hypothetical protein
MEIPSVMVSYELAKLLPVPPDSWTIEIYRDLDEELESMSAMQQDP